MKLFFTALITLVASTLFSQALNANFTASKTVACVGEQIQFTDQSTGNNIITYNWNFGNGETSTSQNPNYSFPMPGTYTVTLTIQNNIGGADAEVKQNYITVHEVPTPSFDFQGSLCNTPATVSFNNTGVQPGTTYDWNFGDGGTSTQDNPSHTYNTSGSYNAVLTATITSTGCSKTVQKQISISPIVPEFQAPSSVCAGNEITFFNQSSSNANTWSWTAQGAGTSTDKNPKFMFTTSGDYTVTLVASDSVSGCSNTVTHTIHVDEGALPSFTADQTTGCGATTITFTNTTQGTGNNYTWDFGDGTNYVGLTPPPHAYSNNGSYTITLTYKDPVSGCMSMYAAQDYIVLSNIQANFTVDPAGGCAPLVVNFADSSITPNATSSPITSWKWNFGNGQTSNVKNPPAQTYNDGVYDVTLIVQTASGCIDTLVMSEAVTVGAKQTAGFTFDSLSTCANVEVIFTNTSIIDPNIDTTEIKWEWEFGGGNSTEKNPHYKFDEDTGFVDVQLVVDYRGCRDTLKFEDTIYVKAPISKFTLNNNIHCSPSFPVTAQTIDNSLLGKDTDIIDVYWKWGDNTQTHVPNGDLHDNDKSSSSHQFTDYGIYEIWQVVENHTTGCVDSTQQTLNISKIDGGFAIPDSVCMLTDFDIDGSLATSINPISDWSYSMGDGFSSSGNPATYAYQSSGTFLIKQTVTSDVGCVATFSKTILVLDLPKAYFTLSPTIGCAPLTTTATNQSTYQGNGVHGLSSYLWTNLDNQSQNTTTTLAQTSSFTFVGDGFHAIGLEVTDDFGCVSKMYQDSIEITRPHASFSMDSVVCNHEEFTVANTSASDSTWTYIWSVDNNIISSSSEASHQFNDAPNSSLSNSHTVQLIIIDAAGCSDTLSKTILVSTPKASFTFDAQGASVGQNNVFTCPPVFVDYHDASTSIGDIVGWHWNFYSQGNQSILQNPSNTFVYPGVYNSSLTITDEYGCKDSVLLTNILDIGGPEANPSIQEVVGQCGGEIIFDLGNNSGVDNYTWDFDNGNSKSDENPFTYVYPSDGTYHPTLTIRDNHGCEVVYELEQVVVLPTTSETFFSVSPDKLSVGDTVTFHDESHTDTPPIISWEWEFEDTTYHFDNGDDWSMIVNHPGEYEVTLTTKTAQGCVSSYTLTFYVDPEVVISNVFTPNGDGINDEAVLIYDFFKEYDIVILNRWGEVIHSNSNQSGKVIWDGKAKDGKLCKDGVYFYKFRGIKLYDDSDTNVTGTGYIHIVGSK